MNMTALGDFGMAVDHINGATDTRLTAAGGFAFVENKVFATRRVEDSFGVASVPGHPGVTVLDENRPVGKTDEDGDVFLPRLISNYPNKISIDPADFTLDTDLPDVDQSVTPSYRTATHITFNAQSSHGELLAVRRPDGGFVDYGLSVTRLRDQERFYSGFDGAVYVTGEPGDIFEVAEPKARCRFTLPPPVPAGQSAPVTCQEAP